jgi:hypothetical protein
MKAKTMRSILAMTCAKLLAQAGSLCHDGILHVPQGWLAFPDSLSYILMD